VRRRFLPAQAVLSPPLSLLPEVGVWLVLQRAS
jgi:hypothetical protein